MTYAAEDAVTAFGEVFHSTRRLRLTRHRVLSGWIPTRPLDLLDPTSSGSWALRDGASASLPYAHRDICRGWARTIVKELGHQIDGLRVPSTIIGDPMVVLFSRAASSIPPSAGVLTTSGSRRRRRPGAPRGLWI